MKYTFTLFIFLGLGIGLSFGQSRTKAYKNYVFQWDSASRRNTIVDTNTLNKYILDYPYSHPAGCWFRHGLVYVKTGDMKGLTDLRGRKLLTPCHYIQFNTSDSIISAYICNTASWIFLDFTGDTLSQGRSSGNYIPRLKDSANPARIITPERSYLWGYLDSTAHWLIEPKFQDALPFENGVAKVQIDSLWGAINAQGEFVIKPQYESSEFEIE